MYVKNGTEWGEDKTGLQRVKLDVNNFSTLRKYAYDMLVFIGSRERERENGSAVSAKFIERALGHRKAEHFFYCSPKEYL